MSFEEISNKEYHDNNLLAETRAKRLRNAIGGTALATYVTLIALNQFDKAVVPQGTVASVTLGGLAGLVTAAAYGLHTKAQRKHERAVEFAAFEVSESTHDHTAVPDWAAVTLQASGKSIDEVLGPKSEK